MGMCVFVTELALPLSALPKLQMFSVLSTSRGTLQWLQSKVCGEEGAWVQNTCRGRSSTASE